MTDVSVADDPRVAAVLEAYLADREAGKAPDPTELIAAHPDIADALADCLGALAALHRGAAAEALRTVGPGDRLGEFRLVREIGRGGMGVVFEAADDALNRRVAVKVLPPTGWADQTERERFRNEARAAAALSHPHIVPVFAVGCDRGVHYFAMQFVPGRSLAHPGETDRVRLAITVLTQAADALAHAHARGIVHRDITPGNLLLDDTGHLWVADFGLARLPGADRLTRTGMLVGTLRYMAPEQVEPRRGLVDHRTDLYGLGAVVYELLAGRPPFPETDRKELLARVLTADPPPLRRLNPAIPVDLETVVLKLLAKEPADRYRSADELAADARRLSAGEPVLARRPSLVERGVNWAGRHRTLTTVSGVTAAVFVFVLVVAQYKLADEREQTRAVVDDFFTKFAEHELAHQPGGDADRRELLLKARDHYERLAGGWNLSADGRLAAARAWRRVADINAKLGRAADAERSYGEALTRLSTLPDAEREQAATRNNRGNLFRHAGRLDEAEADYQVALAGYVGEDADARAGRAGAANNLGLIAQLRDRSTDAANRFRAARDEFERLAGDVYLSEAAACSHNLGRLASDAGQDTDALAEFERAVETLSRVAAPKHRRSLARYRSAVAGALVRLNRAAEAEPLARESADELAHLAADAPHAPGPRFDAASARRTLADALFARNRAADACREYDAADERFTKLAAERVPRAAAEVARTRLAAARAYATAGNSPAADRLTRDAARTAESAGDGRFETQTRELCRAAVARLRP